MFAFLAALISLAFASEVLMLFKSHRAIVSPDISNAARIHALKLAVSAQRFFVTVIVCGLIALRLL